jgi:hypothetical protein
MARNMWEFDNLTDLEKTMARMFEDERIKKIDQDFHQLREPTAYYAPLQTVNEIKVFTIISHRKSENLALE